MDGYNILLVDIDEVTLPFPKRLYEDKAKKVLAAFGYEAKGFSYKLSTAKGIHIAVFVDPPVETLYVPLLQYLLGSDPMRECLNYFRLSRGIDINVLFTSKQKRSRRMGEFGCRVADMSICPGLKTMIELARKNGIDRIWPLDSVF